MKTGSLENEICKCAMDRHNGIDSFIISESTVEIAILKWIKRNLPKPTTISKLKSKPCPYSKTIKCCTMQDFIRNKTLNEAINALGLNKLFEGGVDE